VWDLVPVLSFLFLRGHCRYCGAKISWRYPLVELLTAGGFLFSGIVFADSLPLISALIFFSACLVVFFTDLEWMIVPDAVVFPGALAGFLFALLNKTLPDALLGAAIGAGFLWLVAFLGKAIYKKDVMGDGDVKLAAMLGAFLGLVHLIIALYLAFILGSVIGLFLLLTCRKKREDTIPFAPSLILGALPVFFYGGVFQTWWRGFLHLGKF